MLEAREFFKRALRLNDDQFRRLMEIIEIALEYLEKEDKKGGVNLCGGGKN